MADQQSIRDVVADLTWAELYASKLRKEIKALIPSVKNSQSDPSSPRTLSNCARNLKIRIARSRASRHSLDFNESIEACII